MLEKLLRAKQYFLSTEGSALCSTTVFTKNGPLQLFPVSKNKETMKGHRFAMIEEIKTALMEELSTIPKSAYQKCSENWKKHWYKCIISEGDYFEGDNI